MRVKKEFTVLAFATTAAAMRTEQYCWAEGIPGRLIPLPEEVSAGCGIAWRMLPEEWERWGDRLRASDLPIESVTPVRQWVFEKSEDESTA